jgi:hypothetical protein
MNPDRDYDNDAEKAIIADLERVDRLVARRQPRPTSMIETPTSTASQNGRRCFKSLVAEMLNGRAWSDLDNLEGAIFDRLQDDGHLRTVRGIVVWTPLHAEPFRHSDEVEARP